MWPNLHKDNCTNECNSIKCLQQEDRKSIRRVLEFIHVFWDLQLHVHVKMIHPV